MKRKYKILESEKNVKGYSNFRLPFMPKETALLYRNDLRISLLKLRLENNQMLKSKYITNKKDFFDIENILFYNIGTSTFREISRNGVFLDFEQQNLPITDFNHIVEYELVDNKSSRQLPVDYFASFKFNIPSVSSNIKAGDYWFAFHLGNIEIKRKNINPNSDFGIFLEIESNKRIYNVASIIKSLLDGIISGFHSENKIDNVAASYLSRRYNMTKQKMIEFLQNGHHSILGERNLVSSYRNSVKWNPADERCKEITLTPVKNKANENTIVSGRLYNIE